MGAATWIVFLALLFTIWLVYEAFSPAVVGLSTNVEMLVNASDAGTNSVITQNSLSTLALIGTVWQYFPILLLFGLLLWAMLGSMKTEPQYGEI